MTLLRLALAVAPALTRLRHVSWHARECLGNSHFAEIVRFDGAAILVRPVPRRADRVLFLGKAPPRWNHNRVQVFPRATAALDRHPSVIARTLCARHGFLERYEAAWSEAARIAAGERRDEANDAAFLAKLVERGEGRLSDPSSGLDPRAYVGGLTFVPTRRGCEVRGDVPRDIALALAAMIAERAEAERAADELAESVQLREASAGGDRGAA